MRGWIVWPLAALLFGLLATANAGGYRYGASDQAFYGPALALAADPSLFPRDAMVLAPQMRVWLGDDVYGAIARITGSSQPALFLIIQVVTLAILFAGGAGLMRALGSSQLATAAFLALLTLRHRIAKTGANSIEGYMHPRMLAFGLGLCALACIVRRKAWLAALALLAASVLHPTTAGWFVIVAAVAAATRVIRPRWIVMAVAAGGVVLLFLLLGPLAGRLTVMDAEWLAVLAEKDYLFPAGWPAYAWVINFSYPVVIAGVYRQRRRAGVARPAEAGLGIGLAVLVLIFLISVPLTMARVALAVQLQVTRVFWVLDAVALAYLSWWLVDSLAARRRRQVAVAIVASCVAVSAVRGYYVLRIETGRPLVQYGLAPDDWTDAMQWLRTQPTDWHVLADPAHAWKYGSSVRLAAWRDTVLESSKDSSMAMYDRGLAMRVRARTVALARFDTLTTEQVRRLATEFDIDVFVAAFNRPFDVPVLYRNRQFAVYDLR